MIEPRKLEIIENSLFSSEIKPIIDDAEAIAAGLAPLDDEALNKTHKTREALSKAPELSVVWNSWIDNISQYRSNRSGAWGAPVRAGFNIVNFDNTILDRHAKQFGNWDDEWGTQEVIHPVFFFDLIQEFWSIVENIKINKTHSISLDSIREWLGMSKDGAHDAKNDVLDCAELVVRFLRMKRKLHTGLDCIKCQSPLKIKFEQSLAGWKRPLIK